MSHSHHEASYWTRRHTESVVLDIGEDVGAPVLYARPQLHGREIEVSPLGDCQNAARVHSAVLERSFNSRAMFVAVFPELRAGDYQVCGEGAPMVTISAGAVTELDWSQSV